MTSFLVGQPVSLLSLVMRFERATPVRPLLTFYAAPSRAGSYSRRGLCRWCTDRSCLSGWSSVSDVGPDAPSIAVWDIQFTENPLCTGVYRFFTRDWAWSGRGLPPEVPHA